MIRLTTNLSLTAFAIIAILVGAGLVATSETPAAEKKQNLSMVEKAGRNPVELQIQTVPKSPQSYDTGDRIIVTARAAGAGYLTVVAFSSEKGAAIVFPTPFDVTGAVEKDKKYVLFKYGSGHMGLKVGKKTSESKLIFYFSPKPIKLDALNTDDDAECIVIRPDAKKELDILASSLKAAAASEGFNCVVLPIKGQGGEFLEVVPTPLPKAKGALPAPAPDASRVESSVPEQVDGASGRSRKIKIEK
jgi:hypothetical protein